MVKKLFSQHYSTLKYLIRWSVIAIPVAIAIGSMVALFLWLLHLATNFRFTHSWLLYLLPVGGVVIHLLYKWYGSSAERGNNLIIDEIHQPGAGVPKRMAPLILVTTVITHVFGGSAGREGTAVQIGGSIANLFAGWFKLLPKDKQVILTAGIAAGFGAVFGTPLTGAIFALEVLAIGRIQYNALMPCLVASLIADLTVSAWGVHHTHYHIDDIATVQYFNGHQLNVSFLVLGKVVIASVVFGLAALVFSKATHTVKQVAAKSIKTDWLIPVC
ncbi:MAG: voltage-gated chloride channel protein, partial [Sphingobacteriales bacterium]